MSKKYQEIYDKLSSDIQSHVFQDGEKLPSETQMMETYDVSRQTVRKVLSLLEEDGLIRKSRGSGSFVQNPDVTLNTKRIAVLFFDLDISVFPTMMHRIDEVLYHKGYTAAFYSTGGSMIKERAVLQQLVTTPVDGIIMHAGSLNPICYNLDLIQSLQRMGTKIVFFDSWYANLELSNIPKVCVENYNGPYEIVKYLIHQGYKRIGGFQVTLALGNMARFSGVFNALVQYLGHIDLDSFFEIASPEDAAIVKTPEAIEVLHTLDAFICTSGPLLQPLVESLQLHGTGNLRTIVVFDEVSVPQIDGVEFIVFRHASLEIAEQCVESVLDLIQGKEVLSTQIPWQLSEVSTAKALPAFFSK